MAYCLKCGAYIPDGQSGCLACGYDPEEEKKKAEAESAARSRGGSAAAAQTGSNAEMRARLEEQRRRAREQNRQWAEQEKRRREEAAAREAARKEQQERDRRWAQEEYERRQAEKRAEAESRRSNQSFGEYYRSHTEGGQTSQGNKALAAISYLSVLFAIPYFLAPNDKFVRFHAKQGMKLFLFGIVADVLGALIGLGWLATLFRLYLIYKGMSNALSGKKEELPVIGNIGES